RLGRALRAVRTEIPAGLERAMAMRTAAADALAALRTREEIDADSAPALRAQRPHLPHLGHHAQQFFRRRDAGLHLCKTILAERDHPAGNRRVADLILRRFRGDQPPQLVGDAHHFVDADATAVSRVIALVAADRLEEDEPGGR